MRSENCPCGSEQTYKQCCGRYISGETNAPSPEALMRSRYTAYSQANTDYIAKTQTGPAAKGYDPQASQQWAEQVEWKGLEVLSSEEGKDKGFVTFKAHFLQNNKPEMIFEKSEFCNKNKQWYYFDKAKITRNDPCPCGSGKKYKKCCLA